MQTQTWMSKKKKSKDSKNQFKEKTRKMWNEITIKNEIFLDSHTFQSHISDNKVGNTKNQNRTSKF